MDAVLGSLGLNINSLVLHVINFLVLLIILRVLLLKRVTALLDTRAARIKESLDRAEQVKAEAARAEEEFSRRLAESRRESEAMFERARQAASEYEAQLKQRAEEESNRILERARQQIAQEQEQAFLELRNRVADLTLQAASMIIGRSLDDATHRRLIDEFLAEKTNGQTVRPARPSEDQRP